MSTLEQKLIAALAKLDTEPLGQQGDAADVEYLSMFAHAVRRMVDQRRHADVELSDDWLRQLWRNGGGEFHGPNVETGTMPEAKLLPFMRTLLRYAAIPPMISAEARINDTELAKRLADMANDTTRLMAPGAPEIPMGWALVPIDMPNEILAHARIMTRTDWNRLLENSPKYSALPHETAPTR